MKLRKLRTRTQRSTKYSKKATKIHRHDDSRPEKSAIDRRRFKILKFKWILEARLLPSVTHKEERFLVANRGAEGNERRKEHVMRSMLNNIPTPSQNFKQPLCRIPTRSSEEIASQNETLHELDPQETG